MNQGILETIKTHYGTLNTRIKGVVWSGVVAIIYFVIDTAIIQPLMDEYSEVTKQIELAKAETKILGMGILQLENKTGINTALSADEQVRQLREKIAQLDREIENKANRFVDPDKMIHFVENILTETKNVQLVSLKKIPVEPIREQTRVQSQNNTKTTINKNISKTIGQEISKTYPIYRHGIRFSVKGRYNDLLRYLDKLETTPWQITWSSAELQTDGYPYSELSIVIYTLSLDSTWMRI